jgi:hypothetical protein
MGGDFLKERQDGSDPSVPTGAAPDSPMLDDRGHFEWVDGLMLVPLMTDLIDQAMMPGDTGQARSQSGAHPPALLADRSAVMALSHSDPPGEQEPHYALAELTYSPLDDAEVIGRLRSAGTVYPSCR